MSLDAVLKVGGSLGRGDDLPALCAEIRRLGKKFSLVVVPGGGAFADLVRKEYRRFRLNETAAHSMALLAMDQYGFLLHHLIEGSLMESEPGNIALTARPGRVAVLSPSASVLRDSRLPHSWQVTSDSVAAWVAGQVGCGKLILIKDVDGLLSPGKSENSVPAVIEEMTLKQLAGHDGGVDRYFARVLGERLPETWVLNGLRPERLGELLQTGRTVGTKIGPDFSL